ncbi:MAG: hypothetical protein MJK04_37015, partial [Psychrosphaera sp.]|nr:hypothetical protein [Psychrosphaera sp.]
MQQLIKLLFLLCLVSTCHAKVTVEDNAPSISEIMTRTGLLLHEGAEDLLFKCMFNPCKVSVVQLWQVLDRVEKDVEEVEEGKRTRAVNVLVQMILARGDDSDYRKLLKRSTQKTAGTSLHTEYLAGLSLHWLSRELQLIFAQAKPDNIEFTMSDEPLPVHLTGATDELKQAWRLYRSVMGHFDRYMQNSGRNDRIEVQENWSGFNGVISNFLQDGQIDTVQAISSYSWGGLSATGMRSLVIPK